MIKTAMILAAGRGERLRPYTDVMPKPLLPIAGVAMIVRLLTQLRIAGIERCVINICYLAEQFVEALGNGADMGLEIIWSRESEPLGSAGGIINALPLLGTEPFLLVSGDVVCDYDFAVLLRRDLEGSLVHTVLVPNPDYHIKGDWGLIAGQLTLNEAQKYTFAAIAVIDPVLLVGRVHSITELFLPTIKQGRASGELYEGVYYNVGTSKEYELLIKP